MTKLITVSLIGCLIVLFGATLALSGFIPEGARVMLAAHGGDGGAGHGGDGSGHGGGRGGSGCSGASSGSGGQGMGTGTGAGHSGVGPGSGAGYGHQGDMGHTGTTPQQPHPGQTSGHMHHGQ